MGKLTLQRERWGVRIAVPEQSTVGNLSQFRWGKVGWWWRRKEVCVRACTRVFGGGAGGLMLGVSTEVVRRRCACSDQVTRLRTPTLRPSPEDFAEYLTARIFFRFRFRYKQKLSKFRDRETTLKTEPICSEPVMSPSMHA